MVPVDPPCVLRPRLREKAPIWVTRAPDRATVWAMPCECGSTWPQRPWRPSRDAPTPRGARGLEAVPRSLLPGLERSWEKFLRSPAFLAAQKQSMDGNMSTASRSANRSSGCTMSSSCRPAQDIDRLVTAIEQLDRRVEDQFEDVTDPPGQTGRPHDGPGPDALQTRRAPKSQRLGHRRERPDEAAPSLPTGVTMSTEAAIPITRLRARAMR